MIEFEAVVGYRGAIKAGKHYIELPDCVEQGRKYRVTLDEIEPKLKPCPFCGGEPFYYEADVDFDHHITCTICGANSCECMTKEDAVRNWNRRE